jgi:hypothetical protein
MTDLCRDVDITSRQIVAPLPADRLRLPCRQASRTDGSPADRLRLQVDPPARLDTHDRILSLYAYNTARLAISQSSLPIPRLTGSKHTRHVDLFYARTPCPRQPSPAGQLQFFFFFFFFFFSSYSYLNTIVHLYTGSQCKTTTILDSKVSSRAFLQPRGCLGFPKPPTYYHLLSGVVSTSSLLLFPPPSPPPSPSPPPTPPPLPLPRLSSSSSTFFFFFSQFPNHAPATFTCPFLSFPFLLSPPRILVS